MKINGKSLLLYLLVLIFFSCYPTKNSNQNSSTSTSVEKENKEKIVTPVVVKPNENESPKPTTPKVEKPVIEKPVVEKPEVAKTDKTTPSKSNESATAVATEQDMITELNRLRQNPVGYIADIQEYLVYFERNNFQNLADEKRTAQELITILKNTKPLQKLSFSEDLYAIAVEHGKDIKSRSMQGIMDPHRGSNGSDLTARVAGLKDMENQLENFGTSHDNPKYQIISLLIDSGVPGREHRKNILDPNIDLVAPYLIGNIADFPGCWLQLFGKTKGIGEVSPGDTVAAFTYDQAKKLVDNSNMTEKEKEMMNEINKFRSNPKGYIPHIEAYLVKLSSGEIWSMTSTADETRLAKSFIKDLEKMAPLSMLRYDPKIYEVAKTHGQFLKSKGYRFNPPVSPHYGAGNKGADARIKEGTDMSQGGENIQGTNYGVRETLIGLLIDAGIPGLGHRKALINPVWDHGACHFFGPVPMDIGKSQADNWIQNFGKK